MPLIKADTVMSIAAYDHGRAANLRISHPRCAIVHQSIMQPFQLEPAHDLGALDRLPVELLAMICRAMDVQALFYFRQVNRRARQIISSLHEYRGVSEHGILVFNAILRSGLSHFTIPDLYRQLHTNSCSNCGEEFSRFLFLPTGMRYCPDCLIKSRKTFMISLSALQRASGIGRQRLSRVVPVFQSQYPRNPPTNHQRIALVNVQQALDGIESLNLSFERMIDISTAVYAAAFSNGRLENYIISATESLPYLDPTTGAADYGVECRGCFTDHSRNMYLRHFLVCDGAMDLVDQADAATGGELNEDQLLTM